MAFEDTPNKALIREHFDLPLIKAWQLRKGTLLSYFGMPGPMVRDLITWRPHIGPRTAVEAKGRSKAQQEEADAVVSQMKLNLLLAGWESGFQVLRGDVEDIILDGMDAEGFMPTLSDGKPAHEAKLNYDLINLDFDGGIYYKSNKRRLDRIQCIQKLIGRASGSFILMLTINVRDELGEDLDRYLSDLRSQADGEHATALDWYLIQGDGQRHYKLKAVIPPMIQMFGNAHRFQVHSHAPVFYIGHKKARMLHFVFQMWLEDHKLPTVSTSTIMQLLDLPLLISNEGSFEVDPAVPRSASAVSVLNVVSHVRPELLSQIDV